MSNDDYIIRDRTLIIQKVGIYDESKLEDLLYDEIIINTIPLTNNEDDRKIILDGVIAYSVMLTPFFLTHSIVFLSFLKPFCYHLLYVFGELSLLKDFKGCI